MENQRKAKERNKEKKNIEEDELGSRHANYIHSILHQSAVK